jgi:hypothetical protein
LSFAVQELPLEVKGGDPVVVTKSDNRLAPALPHAPNDAALAAPKGATAARDTSTPASIVFNIILIAVFSLLIIGFVPPIDGTMRSSSNFLHQRL